MAPRSPGQGIRIAQKYGRFEARIKVHPGKGTWAAFWLVGSNIDDVGCVRAGEIDVMEALGGQLPLVEQHAHGPGLNFGDAYTLPDGESVADYYTYAVEWSPDSIAWQVDGRTTRSLTKAQAGDGWVFDHPFFLLLNLAIGGTGQGILLRRRLSRRGCWSIMFTSTRPETPDGRDVRSVRRSRPPASTRAPELDEAGSCWSDKPRKHDKKGFEIVSGQPRQLCGTRLGRYGRRVVLASAVGPLSG